MFLYSAYVTMIMNFDRHISYCFNNNKSINTNIVFIVFFLFFFLL